MLFILSSVQKLKRKRMCKARTKARKLEQFNQYRDSITIQHTFHSLTRSYERNWLTPKQCIKDILDHLKWLYIWIEDKNICLIIGADSKYILSREWVCITVLWLDQESKWFWTKTYKKQFFNAPKIEKKVPVFKRKK